MTQRNSNGARGWSRRLLAIGATLLVVMSCQSGGTPTGLSSEECSDACAKIAAANCGDVGTGCVNSCARGPVPSPASMDCDARAQSYFDCFWRAESYRCDEAVGTLANGCDAQRSALKSCQNAGGAGGAASQAGAAGAGGAAVGEAGAAGASGAEGGSGSLGGASGPQP